MLARLFTCLTLLTAAMSAAHAAPADAPVKKRKPRVAVLEIKSVDEEYAGAAKLLAEMLLTDLARSGRLDVIGASDIATMVGFEKQKQLLGCSEENSCLAEIGGALGVQWLITGSMGRLGSKRLIDLKLVNARRAQVLLRDNAAVDSDDDLLDFVRKVVPKLVSAIHGEEIPAATPALEAKAERDGPRILPPVLVGAGALALGGGLYFGYSALEFNEAKSKLTFDEALHARDDAERKMLIGGTLAAVGATAVITGVSLWLFGGEEAAPVASIGPDGAFVALAGSF